MIKMAKLCQQSILLTQTQSGFNDSKDLSTVIPVEDLVDMPKLSVVIDRHFATNHAYNILEYLMRVIIGEGIHFFVTVFEYVFAN
jgi:hypothetical protein